MKIIAFVWNMQKDSFIIDRKGKTVGEIGLERQITCILQTVRSDMVNSK